MDKMKKPKISVIIPVYNVAAYIGQCIDSLAKQSFRDVEIICVDDCSTDGTLDILEDYARNDNRVRVIRQECNQGVSAARNAGLDAAAGSYILFVDSDDYHEDGSLQRLYDVSEKHELDVVQFELEAFLTSGSPGFINMNPDARVNSIGKILSGPEMMVLQLAGKEYSCSVVLQMFRAEILKESGVRFFPGIIHEDEMFTPMALENARRVMCINDRLYKRRVRSNSIMTTAVTHRNVDGYFVVATELMAKYIAGGCVNEGMGIRAKVVLGSSLNRYRMLSDEEKLQAGKNLPEIHNFLFERSLIRIEDEKNRVQRLRQQIDTLNQQKKQNASEIKALKEQNMKLKAQKDEISRAFADMENSISFKIGRRITSIPRKLRSLLKHIMKR